MTERFEGDEHVRAVAARVVGLSEDAAVQLVHAAGIRFRVVDRDGVEPALSMDHRADRINVRLTKGVVTHLWIG